MESDDARLLQWIGKSETARDWIAPDRARALQATLDRMHPLLDDGAFLPPLWHWLYFWTIVPQAGLGRDGHPALGGFLPPVGAARRMWAGSRVAFPGCLKIGDHAQRTSTIADVTVKTGRTGRLVFVTVRHEITGRDGLAVVDEQDIVYREDVGQGTTRRVGEPAPTGATYSEEVCADPTMLFRYSALTFNGHRIHYDRTYATEVESYPGLVVHGPLLATLMVGLAVRSCPERAIEGFEFRGHRPVVDGAPFTVCGTATDNASIELWIADAEGELAMRGRARFR